MVRTNGTESEAPDSHRPVPIFWPLRTRRMLSRADHAKPNVVVAVAGVVVVAIGSANVPGIVVPRTATINPVGARFVIDRQQYD